MSKAKRSLTFQDKRGLTAPLMRPAKGHIYETGFTGTAVATAEITEEAVRIEPTKDCYIKFGVADTVTVSASEYDAKLVGGMLYDFKLFDTDKFISIIQVYTAGTAYIHGWR